MANEPYITKTDLGEVTQKVTIENSKDIAKPLIDQQKKNDLKELEKSIEQKSVFQDIAAGISAIPESLIKGLKNLIPKTDGGLSKMLGLGFGLLLAPFVAFINFVAQLGLELKPIVKLFTKPIGWLFKPLNLLFKSAFTRLKETKFSKKIISVFNGVTDKFKKLFKPVTDFFAKNKFIQKAVTLFKTLFTGEKGFFSMLAKLGGDIKDFVTGGKFKKIMGFAGKFGRIMGKLFFPITLILSLVDIYRGFMRGYSEGGLKKGIKEAFNELFEGLVGDIARLLMWIPTKIATWLGFDNFAKSIGEYTETIIKSVKDVFGGLVDLVVAVFTWDTQGIKNSLVDIWKGITSALLAPLGLIAGFVKDIFGGSVFDRIKLTLKEVSLNLQSFFLYLNEGVGNLLSKIPESFLTDDLIDYIKNTNESIRKTKSGVDSEIEEIKVLKNRLKLQDGLLKNEQTNNGASSGGINSNSSMANVNNVTYNINAPSDYSAAAMKFMTA